MAVVWNLRSVGKKQASGKYREKHLWWRYEMLTAIYPL